MLRAPGSAAQAGIYGYLLGRLSFVLFGSSHHLAKAAVQI
jgi:hypothetical protein